MALPVVNCEFIYKSLCSVTLQITFGNVPLKISDKEPNPPLRGIEENFDNMTDQYIQNYNAGHMICNVLFHPKRNAKVQFTFIIHHKILVFSKNRL